MDAKVELKKQIEADSQFKWLDDIYTVSIPQEKRKKTDENIALITDINSQLALWGNDSFNSVNKFIQIQIYFSLKTNINFDQSVENLVGFLLYKKWLSNGYSFFTDPDTQQQSVTIKLHKIL